MSNELTIQELWSELKNEFMPRIKNFLGSEHNALKFLSAVMFVAQTTPQILACERNSVYRAFMKCAELGLYPSSISWEAFIIPYNKSVKEWNKWIKISEAQFQLGYQWIVTLLIRSWVSGIYSGIIRENDKSSYVDWVVKHEIDMKLTAEERWEPIGAYATAIYNWQRISHYMNISDIYKFRNFSKSAFTKNDKTWEKELSSNTPWNPEKDPELWMPRKTVLKQLSKFLPKTEDVFKGIYEDNQDSIPDITTPKSRVIGWADAMAQLEDIQDPQTSEIIPPNTTKDE